MPKLLYMITTHSYDSTGAKLLFSINDDFYENYIKPLGVLEFQTIQVFEMSGMEWKINPVGNAPCLLHTQEFGSMSKEQFQQELTKFNLAVFEELEGWS